MQPSLLDLKPRFDGTDLQPHDHARLSGQLQRIYDLLTDGQWWTVQAISARTGDPEPSISAQLRNLRKPRFGGHTVRRKRVGNLSYYQLDCERSHAVVNHRGPYMRRA